MYIKLKLGSYTIHHGYDDENNELTEKIDVEAFTEKIVKIDRIQSLTKSTILITSGYGREIYWEYQGSLTDIEQRLRDAGLLI